MKQASDILKNARHGMKNGLCMWPSCEYVGCKGQPSLNTCPIQPTPYNPRHVPMIPLEGVPCIDYDTGKAWGFDLVFIHQTNGCWPIAASWYSGEHMKRLYNPRYVPMIIPEYTDWYSNSDGFWNDDEIPHVRMR